jgi:hypothetical protein
VSQTQQLQCQILEQQQQQQLLPWNPEKGSWPSLSASCTAVTCRILQPACTGAGSTAAVLLFSVFVVLLFRDDFALKQSTLGVWVVGFKVQAQFKSTTSKVHPGRSGVASTPKDSSASVSTVSSLLSEPVNFEFNSLMAQTLERSGSSKKIKMSK